VLLLRDDGGRRRVEAPGLGGAGPEVDVHPADAPAAEPDVARAATVVRTPGARCRAAAISAQTTTPESAR
jgi:hypothetical protein